MGKRGKKQKYFGIDKEIYSLYSRKGLSPLCEFSIFKIWYLKNHGICYYCGITGLESELLYRKYPESTRGGRRGKKLELDRKKPKTNYYDSIENLCFSCYWCNNSKSNHFNDIEFKEIGYLIGKINRIKLKN